MALLLLVGMLLRTCYTELCYIETVKKRTGQGASASLRVDDLARLAGTTTRHVRALQTSGLLPPPALRGRTGLYDRSHLARLSAILRLQRSGFSLGALRALFSAWEEGLSLGDVLGMPPRTAAAGGAAKGGATEAGDEEVGAFADWPTRRGPRALAVVPSTLLGGAALGQVAS